MGTIETLKPCPFCGGADIHFDRHVSGASPTGEVWSTCCYQCGATFPNRYLKQLLVDCWNRRALSASPSPDMYEALKAINRLASPSPSRTFDDAIRDLGYIADFARSALQKATPQEIR